MFIMTRFYCSPVVLRMQSVEPKGTENVLRRLGKL